MLKSRRILIVILLVLLALVASAAMEIVSLSPHPTAGFDGERAYKDVLAQVNFGPRLPDSRAHTDTISYIEKALFDAGWTASVETIVTNGHPAQNIVATRGGVKPVILLGAHYDSRIWASNDSDSNNQRKPVPGADDGASGVAVLLEIARSLPADSPDVGLVFFDIEDNGEIPGWGWIEGSRAYANALTTPPQVVVVVDMVGDADLNIYQDQTSDPEYTRQIWDAAKRLGYESAFIPQTKYSVEDDHTPFLQKGIRAVDIIDLDYPYWHTIQDTSDKVSPKSLQIVGETLLAWIRDFKK